MEKRPIVNVKATAKPLNWTAMGVFVTLLVGLGTLGCQTLSDVARKRAEADRAAIALQSDTKAADLLQQQRCSKFILLGKQYWKNSVLFAQSLSISPSADTVLFDRYGRERAQKADEFLEAYERNLELQRPMLSIRDYAAFHSYYLKMYPTSEDIQKALRDNVPSARDLIHMDKTGRHRTGESFTKELESYCRRL